MKNVAILQSNYIPWKGYFDIINRVDEFILYDDVQYTRRDWRNRNQIKTIHGSKWISIPVDVKGKFDQKIKDTKISDFSWAEQHWNSIQTNYAKTDYFHVIGPRLKEVYKKAEEQTFLTNINYLFIKEICELLDIKTKITFSMDYGIIDGRSERLLDLCLKTDATTYLSGPAAKDYLDESIFNEKGISVEWMNYSGYPEYPQLHPPFAHAVSVVDLLFNVGPIEAKKFMLTF